MNSIFPEESNLFLWNLACSSERCAKAASDPESFLCAIYLYLDLIERYPACTKALLASQRLLAMVDILYKAGQAETAMRVLEWLAGSLWQGRSQRPISSRQGEQVGQPRWRDA